MMLTERFADFIYRTTFEDLPGDIVSLAKERILDSVGAILAGAGNWVCRDQFLTTCKAQGLGAAAAAGRLLGLTKEQIANALGLAGPYASGLMEATVTGQLSKCEWWGMPRPVGWRPSTMRERAWRGRPMFSRERTDFLRLNRRMWMWKRFARGWEKDF